MKYKTISSTFGNNLRFTLFGGSHEPEIGIHIDGLKPGLSFDLDRAERFMRRRAPGTGPFVTPRKEQDELIISQGLDHGKTTGERLTIVIKNTNVRSGDYSQLRQVPRPGHADFTARLKYGNQVNMAGGGPFSARMTAPLCAAGALALQLLEKRGIFIGSHVYSIGSVSDKAFDPVNVSADNLRALQETEAGYPGVLDREAGEKMIEEIRLAMEDQDSLGGVVEACALGLPGGIGGPMYDGIEGHLARVFFGIPAVKGVEFGRGFESARIRGSENNDPFLIKDGQVVTATNNHGGLLGGITTGMPLICRIAFKPTPSIGREQDSVNLTTMTPEKLRIEGRHDPCVVLRALPIVEAALAVTIMDLLEV